MGNNTATLPNASFKSYPSGRGDIVVSLECGIHPAGCWMPSIPLNSTTIITTRQVTATHHLEVCCCEMGGGSRQKAAQVYYRATNHKERPRQSDPHQKVCRQRPYRCRDHQCRGSQSDLPTKISFSDNLDEIGDEDRKQDRGWRVESGDRSFSFTFVTSLTE